ncbi:MAG: hypothetical protein Q9181_001149 [Wetmoreana brouardii]
MPYSHSDTILSFSSFYNFLTGLPYIPPSAVLHPPSTGWSSIDHNVFSSLGKTQEVLNLLRHLPYLEGEHWNIAYDTKVIPYNGPRVKAHLEQGDSLENSGLKPFGCDDIPAHVIPLTCGESYGSWLMCDTIEGTITEYIPLGSPASDGRRWRDYLTLPIGDFLEAWKRKYMELEWIPMPGKPGNIAMAGELREIYHACGWPSPFRRDECYDALLKRDRQVKEKLLQKSSEDIDKKRLRKATDKLAQASF